MEFLEELNKKFKYQYDRDQYDHRDAWYVMKHEPYIATEKEWKDMFERINEKYP